MPEEIPAEQQILIAWHLSELRWRIPADLPCKLGRWWELERAGADAYRDLLADLAQRSDERPAELAVRARSPPARLDPAMAQQRAVRSRIDEGISFEQLASEPPLELDPDRDDETQVTFLRLADMLRKESRDAERLTLDDHHAQAPRSERPRTTGSRSGSRTPGSIKTGVPSGTSSNADS